MSGCSSSAVREISRPATAYRGPFQTRTRVPEAAACSSAASISARQDAISSGRTTSPSSTCTRTDSGAMACSPSPSTISADVCSGPIEKVDHVESGAPLSR